MAEKKEIKVKETKEVKAKKQKAEKTVPAKKLPKILKKTYTKDALEKKLLKKIYIEADRKMVASLFKPATDKKGREIMCIDKTSALPKEQFERCKVVAKDVVQQKGGFKLIPFLAMIAALVLIGLVVTLFKNVVVKKGVTGAMQGIFEARTDIERVDLQIFGATLEIDGLAQANKDSPMKNLFQIDKIMIDFDLTDLLRGKFHAHNIEVSGVAIGTDREKSGELLKKEKDATLRSEMKELEEKQSSLNDMAAAKLKEMFANYNPETMLANIQNELKSPEMAKKIASEVQGKVTKWQNVPNEYKTSVDKLTSSVNSLVKTDWGRINDPVKLKKALEDLNTAYTESQSLQKKLDSTTKDIKGDTTAVTNYSNELKAAIKADTALVDAKITEMKQTFSPAGLQSIMTDAVQGILYEKTGKLYPYASKAMNAALSAKGSSDNKAPKEKSEKKEKPKKAKKQGPVRLAGRTVYYKKDTVPKVLIDNVKASGYEFKTNELLFQGIAKDISSDQNMCGKPATVSADFKVMGKANKANVVVDARDNSTAKLITADYSGKGYPVSADASVFKVNSNSDISAKMTADADGTFVIGGTLDMNVTEMTGMEFEPAKISALYNNAVKGVKKLTIGFNIGYDAEKGVVVEITNADKLAKQLVTPVTAALTSELNAIAADAKNNVTKVLSEKTGIASDQISAFTDISSVLNGQMNSVKDMQKQMDKKKAEIQKQIEKQAAGAAKDAAASALKKLF